MPTTSLNTWLDGLPLQLALPPPPAVPMEESSFGLNTDGKPDVQCGEPSALIKPIRYNDPISLKDLVAFIDAIDYLGMATHGRVADFLKFLKESSDYKFHTSKQVIHRFHCEMRREGVKRLKEISFSEQDVRIETAKRCLETISGKDIQFILDTLSEPHKEKNKRKTGGLYEPLSRKSNRIDFEAKLMLVDAVQMMMKYSGSVLAPCIRLLVSEPNLTFGKLHNDYLVNLKTLTLNKIPALLKEPLLEKRDIRFANAIKFIENKTEEPYALVLSKLFASTQALKKAQVSSELVLYETLRIANEEYEREIALGDRVKRNLSLQDYGLSVVTSDSNLRDSMEREKTKLTHLKLSVSNGILDFIAELYELDGIEPVLHFMKKNKIKFQLIATWESSKLRAVEPKDFSTSFEAVQGNYLDFEPKIEDMEFKSTDAPPGSEEKKRIMKERLDRGLPLWHDDDPTVYGSPDQDLYGE